MVSEIDKLVIVAALGVVGTLITIVVNEHFKRRFMVCEFVWKHKVEAYGKIMRELHRVREIASYLVHWIEIVKKKEVAYALGYAAGMVFYLEDFVCRDLPELKGLFEGFGKKLDRPMEEDDREELKEMVKRFIRDVGVVCASRLHGIMSDLQLLMDDGIDVRREVLEGLVVWSRVEGDPERFDKMKMSRFWNGLLLKVQDAMKKDLDKTLRIPKLKVVRK